MITIQLDCAIAENFDMYYIDQNGEKQRPYVIHRTSMDATREHLHGSSRNMQVSSYMALPRTGACAANF